MNGKVYSVSIPFNKKQNKTKKPPNVGNSGRLNSFFFGLPIGRVHFIDSIFNRL